MKLLFTIHAILILLLLGESCPVVAEVFPPTVSDECSASWHESKGKEFLVATVNVLIDLKNDANEIEEKAFIHLDCKGKTDDHGNDLVPRIIGSTCVGIRMNGLDRRVLSSPWVFPIYPDEISLVSTPGHQPVILKWQERSAFVIESGRSFQWEMKSALTEKTHSGTVTCK